MYAPFHPVSPSDRLAVPLIDGRVAVPGAEALRQRARAVIQSGLCTDNRQDEVLGARCSVLGPTGTDRSRRAPSTEHRAPPSRASVSPPSQTRCAGPAANGSEERQGLLWQRISCAAEADERIPALIVRPAGTRGRLPAVVVLHNLGGSKESMTGWMEELARRGYLALAIDARWHGERGPGLQTAMIRAYRTGLGHPYVFDTVADLFRTLDYLQSRSDVDPGRIGMIGLSMGGQETWITAALDPRVRVAVPAVGVNSFGWTVEHNCWQPRAGLLPRVYEAVRTDLGEPELNLRVYRAVSDQLTPGLLDCFDGPGLLPLIAPRPLLILNGEADPLVPIGAARLAANEARRAYEALSVPNRFCFDVAPGVGHTITADQQRLALDWFDRWLRGGTGERLH